MNNTTVSPTKLSALCQLYPDKPNRCKVILAVHQTSTSLSLIGCVLVIFLIILLKKYKLFVQKMVLAMVISAFFGCVGFLIGDVTTTNEHTCRLQAILTQYFDWAVVLWISVITANMLLVVKNYNNTKYMPVYHAVVWIGALFWTIIPFFENAYGKAGIWCWIKKDSTGYRFGTYYGPVMLLLVLLVVMYVYIIYTVIQTTKPESGQSVEIQRLNERYRDELKPLIWYPIVFLVLMIPMLMYRIEDASHPTKPPNYALIIIGAIVGPSDGAVNAFVFTIVNASLRELSWEKVKTEMLKVFRREGETTRVTHDMDIKDEVSTAPSSGYCSSAAENSAVEMDLEKYA